jgi:hypothetical protein
VPLFIAASVSDVLDISVKMGDLAAAFANHGCEINGPSGIAVLAPQPVFLFIPDFSAVHVRRHFGQDAGVSSGCNKSR